MVLARDDARKRLEFRSGRGAKSAVKGRASGKWREREPRRSCVGRYGDGGGGALTCIEDTYAVGGVVICVGIGTMGGVTIRV